MTTTGQLRTFSDFYNDLTNRIRAQTGTSGPIDVMKRYINIALQDIHIGAKERMPWAERQAVLVSNPPYTTGTVTLSQGSTTVLGSGAVSWTGLNAVGVANCRKYGKFLFSGGLENYEAFEFVDGATVTLSSAYTQASASGASYTYFEDEYDLASDFLRPVDFRFFDRNRQITMLPRNEFRMNYVRQQSPNKPTHCTIVDRPPTVSSNGLVRRVLFNRPTDKAYSFPYSYITKNLVVGADATPKEEFASDTDEPLLPLPYRHIIVAKALYWAYRDRRDDRRSNEANQEFMDLWLRIANDNEFGQARPTMSPRMGGYYSAAKRPMSGSTPRVVSGTAFDELRE
jgi:hypothetical protein